MRRHIYPEGIQITGIGRGEYNAGYQGVPALAGGQNGPNPTT